MKNSIRLFILLLGLLPLSVSHSQITIDEVRKSIDVKNLQHPYLFFTEADKQIIRSRIESDSESRNIMKALLAEGNRLLRMPFEKKILHEPRHPRFESGNEALSYLSRMCKGALTLAFLYQMTGDEKYVKRGYEYAEAICDVPEWRYQVHSFDIIYPRVWPWNVPDDQVVFSYDLNSSRVARILSTVYDWLYPVLSQYQKNKIRNAVLEKAITRARGNYEFFWWASAYKCNWSSVCFGGLGVSALALLKESPQLADVVAESFNRINLTFDQIGDEGGWQEGRGYFSYMLEGGLFFGDALKRISKGKFNLFNHPKIQKNALDFQLYALTASFGDSHGEPGGSTFLLNKYVEETKSSTSAFYREKFVGQGEEIFDIIWPRSSVKPLEPKEKSRFFKNINWAVMRSDFFDPNSVTIACKAGYNDDPHHGHLDCGHFILTWKNTQFIKDLGGMPYDENYFNDERFDYAYASSEGHNLIFVNNEKQITAKKKDSPWLDRIGGKILDFRSGDKRDYVLMDPTAAYPDKELKKWRRNIVLEKPEVTLILDEVHSNVGADIRARFFPGVADNNNHARGRRNQNNSNEPSGSFENNKNHVVLKDGKGNRMALIPVILNNDLEIIVDKLASMAVSADEKLEWFPYIETKTRAHDDVNLIATLILPVKSDDEAAEKTKSLKISLNNENILNVSVQYKGKELVWNFMKSEEGYILQ